MVGGLIFFPRQPLDYKAKAQNVSPCGAKVQGQLQAYRVYLVHIKGKTSVDISE